MEALKTITNLIYRFYKKFRFYAVILTIFTFFYIFYGDYTLLDRLKYEKELNSKTTERDRYEKEIIECNQTMENLEKNNDELERYAREVYYMKKKNEDIFLIDE